MRCVSSPFVGRAADDLPKSRSACGPRDGSTDGGARRRRRPERTSIPSPDPAPDELALVFVVSATCLAESPDLLLSSWQRIVEASGQRANALGIGFRVIGVAVSEDVEEGLSILRRLGGMTELNVGGGWASLGVRRYMREELIASGETPQVVVLVRSQHAAEWGRVSEVPLARFVGIESISRWSLDGAPVDTDRLRREITRLRSSNAR